MEHISAADNYSVQTNNVRWRLLYNNRPLLEASREGLRYGKYFSQSRRLPATGQLAQKYVLRVVLGWQAADETWHLGLIVAPELAEKRGSRWCELIRWPDPDVTVFQNLAESAGRTLSQSLGVPFQVIPPRTARQAKPVTPLPQLPLDFGLWSMYAAERPNQVELRRSPRWARQRVQLMLWYALWAIVYFSVSALTITSDIALPNAGTLLPNPQWLPYLGIATGVLFILAIFYQFLRITLTANRIIVDGTLGTVSAWRGNNQHWERSSAEIQSIYVSEVVRKSEVTNTTEYGELNLHLGGGKFHFVLSQGVAEKNGNRPRIEGRTGHQRDNIIALEAANINSDLQAAALHMARLLGDTAVWHDVRTRNS